jgi:serine/threonine protein kinase
LKEILVLCDLDHPSIVPFLGVCDTVPGLGETACIIFPWYKNGSLEKVLESDVAARAKLPERVSGLSHALVPSEYSQLRLRFSRSFVVWNIFILVQSPSFMVTSERCDNALF